MRIGKSLAGVFLIAILAIPTTASAVDWQEWKRLVRKRPVAVLVAIPPMVLTSPFMLATWLLRDRSQDEDADE